MVDQTIDQPTDRTVDVLTRNWWLIALRGVAALVFGVLTFFRPVASLAVLVLFFGAYAVVDGLFTVFAALANRHGERHWVALLLGGILSVVIGILTFMMPGVTAIVLLYIIAAWAVITGVAEIVTAIRLRRVITGEWLLIVAGLISVALGVVLIIRPAVGALAVVLWIGVYAMLLGVLLIGLAFRLRSWGRGRVTEGTVRTV